MLLMLPDVPQFAAAWLGAVKAGGVVSAVNPGLKPDEMRYYLDYTRAKMLVADAEHRARRSSRCAADCPTSSTCWWWATAGRAPRRTTRELDARDAGPLLRAHPPRRPGGVALHLGLHRLPQGRGAQAARLRLQRAHLRAAHRRLPRGRRAASRCRGWPSATRWARTCSSRCSPAGRPLLFQEKPTPREAVRAARAAPAHDAHRGAHRAQRHPQRAGGGRRSTSPRCASPSAPARRCRPSCTSGGRSAPAWRSSTASARPRCSTSSSPTALGDVKLGSLGRVVEGYEAKVCDDAGPGAAARRGRHALGAGRLDGARVLAAAREVEAAPSAATGASRPTSSATTRTATSTSAAAATTCSRSAASGSRRSRSRTRCSSTRRCARRRWWPSRTPTASRSRRPSSRCKPGHAGPDALAEALKAARARVARAVQGAAAGGRSRRAAPQRPRQGAEEASCADEPLRRRAALSWPRG